MEIKVKQQTTEWQELRRSVCLTASCFGDALGIGCGKPFDFLRSIIEPHGEDAEPTACIRHGILMEPVINDAYQLLTGNRTQPSGFWIHEGGPLHHLVGASPDAKVCDRKSHEIIGLAEFKAPVYRNHGSKSANRSSELRQSIPRAHMAQMQGQMAICKADWCDYMSLCANTREIMLVRVYFEADYWRHISRLIENFCHVVQIARERQKKGQLPLMFDEAAELKLASTEADLFPAEDCISVDNLLTVWADENVLGQQDPIFMSTAGVWMAFDFLIGEDPFEPRISM